MDARKNVFVIGLDEHNRQILEGVNDAAQYRFHSVLAYEEIYGPQISFNGALQAAQRVLDSFDGPIDAIIGFWDFPVSAMVPLLRRRYGLPAASLEELIKCEHKYWSRLIQREVLDEYPPFGLVDPAHDQNPPQHLRYPLWIKPVKSFSSVLAFGVADQDAFRQALGTIREGIGRIGEPFDALLEHLQLPPEIAAVGGQMCLAEEAIAGRQLTVEGYRYDGEVVLYGVIDSVRYDNSPSFLRFQYPSTLPEQVIARLEDISTRLVTAIGLDTMTFNIEYFWDPGTDAITLLEINPRHSQSHAELFADVDGMSNHEVMLRLALGRDPDFPHRKGRYPMAAKCFVRRFTDGYVRRHPTGEEIQAIERIVPGVTIDLIAHTGDVLSEQPHRDSYSYHVASVYIGAADETDLAAKFDQVAAALVYEIDDVTPEM
ncbi:ATP-grasp domain-containing protein [Haloechinothrix sp. YIM 98757]|uniref:ATP-grasp domain-containing protein n=1 Tax=Haloechinothrix aidingensis TaxID=2752311 RepID=A0A838AFQ1_9PSEU|nr:ATP-grasp domain-containing protein [Haloechinothrix aidingensis]MBA0128194.1 ATP-grasp domain-containing protein [Haloechinothrix aidingensis]